MYGYGFKRCSICGRFENSGTIIKYYKIDDDIIEMCNICSNLKKINLKLNQGFYWSFYKLNNGG